MKTQKSNRQMYCPAAALRYARVLFDLQVSEEAVETAKAMFEKVPQLHDIFVNPTLPLKKKLDVIDRVFPQEIRNFLKVVCKYQRMDLIKDIFDAYERYCAEQKKVLNAVLTCTMPPTEEQKQGMEAFLCKKYGASEAHIEVCRDEDLLGGFVLRVGSDEYDWSMRGRLDRLKEKLTWR